MKKRNLLILFCLLSMSTICYADTVTSTGGKLRFKCTTPDSVVNKANQAPSLYSPYSSVLQDPMVNSMLGGYSSMIQGAAGGSYSVEEMKRQQMDYAKQKSDSQEFNEAE